MLKTTMQVKTRHIITLLFSIYFSLFVLSPICYTADGLSEENGADYQAHINITSLHVIWELKLSKYLPRKNAGSSKQNVRLLIKKARALVSSNYIEKLSSSGSAEFDYSDIIFSLNFHSSLGQYAKSEYRTGSYLVVSGLSPPYFS